jgi:hypothetical protein
MGKKTSKLARLFSCRKGSRGRWKKFRLKKHKKAAGEENYSGILRNKIGSRSRR